MYGLLFIVSLLTIIFCLENRSLSGPVKVITDGSAQHLDLQISNPTSESIILLSVQNEENKSNQFAFQPVDLKLMERRKAPPNRLPQWRNVLKFQNISLSWETFYARSLMCTDCIQFLLLPRRGYCIRAH